MSRSDLPWQNVTYPTVHREIASIGVPDVHRLVGDPKRSFAIEKDQEENLEVRHGKF